MANTLYSYGRAAFLTGGINWTSDDIRVSLVSSSYTPNFSTDQYYSVISGGAIVATMSASMTTKTATAGVANADPVTFSSVTGSQVVAFVIYKNTGTPSTSPLIAWFDTATNLPITPNGGNITVTFDTGANKIFQL